MNLIELSDEERNWLEALTHVGDEGDPISEEEQARIIEEYIKADEQFKSRVDRYCELIAAYDARAGYRADCAERLAQLARLDHSVAGKLKARVKAVMESRGDTQIETDNHRLKIVKNGGALPVIVPESWLAEPASAPEAFQRRVIQLDKQAIREAIRNSEETHGACLGERGTRLSIL